MRKIMVDDSFTETTSESWLSRMKNAIGGVIIGIILVPGSIWLLSWNEGRSVQTYRSLSEGQGLVKSISPDRVDPAAQGKLVHLSGRMVTKERIGDPTFGISATAVRLIRTVEMYQWKENRETRTREKVGGGKETITRYTYERTWSNRVIDSGSFRRPEGHRNPGGMRFSSRQWIANNVTVGAYRLPRGLVGRVGPGRAVTVTSDMAARMGERAGIEARSSDGRLYIGYDPGRPRIGDLRIGFEAVPPQPVSLIAQQNGQTFGPYQTEAGDKLYMIRTGTVSAKAMFKEAESANSFMTWLIRAGGMLLMFIAFAMILKPITLMGAFLPILSQIVQLGTGLVALLLTAIIAPLTIAIAWIVVRPVLGIVVLAVGGALVVGVIYLLRQRRKAAGPALAAAGATAGASGGAGMAAPPPPPRDPPPMDSPPMDSQRDDFDEPPPPPPPPKRKPAQRKPLGGAKKRKRSGSIIAKKNE